MHDSVLLNAVINESGWKRKTLALQLNLTPQGLAKKIEGITEFKISEVVTLCDLLKVDIEERERIFFTPNGESQSTLQNPDKNPANQATGSQDVITEPEVM